MVRNKNDETRKKKIMSEIERLAQEGKTRTEIKEELNLYDELFYKAINETQSKSKAYALKKKINENAKNALKSKKNMNSNTDFEFSENIPYSIRDASEEIKKIMHLVNKGKTKEEIKSILKFTDFQYRYRINTYLTEEEKQQLKIKLKQNEKTKNDFSSSTSSTPLEKTTDSIQKSEEISTCDKLNTKEGCKTNSNTAHILIDSTIVLSENMISKIKQIKNCIYYFTREVIEECYDFAMRKDQIGKNSLYLLTLAMKVIS